MAFLQDYIQRVSTNPVENERNPGRFDGLAGDTITPAWRKALSMVKMLMITIHLFMLRPFLLRAWFPGRRSEAQSNLHSKF